LIFDATTWPMGGRWYLQGWNLQALYGFTARWTESNASALVASGVSGATRRLPMHIRMHLQEAGLFLWACAAD
jgi:hypothetical protein